MEEPAPVFTGQPLTSDDLIYKGAFRYPQGIEWAYSGQALTYYPGGDPSGAADGYPGSLYAAGSMVNEIGDRIGQISIPVPVLSDSFDALPRATVLQPLTDITGGWKDNCTYNEDCMYREIDGLAYLSEVDKIVWNLNDWYNVGAYDQDSLGWSNLDMSNARGVWHIGPRPSDDNLFHNAKTCNYLFTAPKAFADTYLNGKRLIAGNTREAGANGGSQGPTLYASAPWEDGSPPDSGQELDALPLLYYREWIDCVWDWPDIKANPQPGDCDFPGYRAFDHWNGGAWIDAGGKSTVLIVGRKGLGPNCYGNVECADHCDTSQGYHAYPYDPQILFYDPQDLIEVIQGLRDPWSVLPTETYSISDVVLNPSCAEPGAAAYDRERSILYITEQQAGPDGETVVHVWEVRQADTATYYVRTDGGTAEQCTGLVDAPYPGSGIHQACAWSHPFWALTDTGEWKLKGGDTLIIGSGSYPMGIGAPNTGWCEAAWAYDCHLPPLPSGPSPGNPTRILGAGWDQGCTNPPEMWGTERPWQVISLEGTDNALIACLELTDHSGCVEFHANSQVTCKRDNPPFGDWAANGIIASDSANVTLKNLNIHGFAAGGIRAGRLTDWTVENVRIAGNGWVGWEGDIYDSDANTGTLRFINVTVEWNGCAESYPNETMNNCWAQTAGGYGDGLGTGETGGHWVIEDSIFRYNTSDGLDLLYVRLPSQIDIRRTQSYGNAGDQIKVNGPTRIENSLMASNCAFFEDKSFTYNVDNCRAGGSALALNFRRGNQISVVNSTIAGQGDCLCLVECDSGDCNGSETLTVQNNIFMGYPDFLSSDQACYIWYEPAVFGIRDTDYNVVFNAKIGNVGLSAHDLVQDPLVMDDTLETFDGRLKTGSPAMDSGLPVGALGGLIPDHDLEKISRPQKKGVDRGAYERRSLRCITFVTGDFDGDGHHDLAGLNSSDAVFYSTDLSTWTQIPGTLKSLTVGDFNHDGKDDLAGLNDTGSIFYTTNLNTWNMVPGALESLMAGDFNGDGNADLVGVNAVGGVYYTTDLSTWTRVPGTIEKLVTGDFNNDGSDDLAGLNSYGLIYYTTDLNTWSQVAGSLEDLVVGAFNHDGLDDMAGLNAQGNVYYTVNLTSWTQVPGAMAQLLSADLNGNGVSDLAGLNSVEHIYYTTDLNTWTQIPGALARLISGNLDGIDGDSLAGLNASGGIFYTTNLNTWIQIPGNLAP